MSVGLVCKDHRPDAFFIAIPPTGRKSRRHGHDERPPSPQRMNGLFLWSTALTLALTYAAPCALAMACQRFRADSRYWRRKPHVMYSAAARVPAKRKGTL